MSEVVWGYCRYCNKEIETQGGRLIEHLESYQGPPCRGTGQGPFRSQPQEGAWTPLRRPARPCPEPEPGPARMASRGWLDYFRGLRG